MSIIKKLGITPGPWRRSEIYNVVTSDKKGFVSGSKTVCDLNKFNDQWTKNGDIIASAPEMLEDGLFNCELLQKIKESIYEPDKIHIYLERMKTGSYEKATEKSWPEIKELLS